MTADVEQTSQSFGQWIGSLSELSSKFSLHIIPDESCINESELTAWYTNTLTKFGGSSQKHVFELAVKNLMYQYVHESKDTDIDASSSSIVMLGSLLDTVAVLVRLGHVDVTLPLILVEELFEIQTIGWCQVFWPYMISRERALTSNLTGIRAPGTTLIRLCNSLLRRLSKTQNAQFSGEIAIFLARAFPLSEKSGLNIRGSFNTENVTFYEGDGTTQDNKIITKDDDVPMVDPGSSANLTEEDELYRKFWFLQCVFSNPVLLTTSPETLADFKTNVIEILSELKRREAAHNTKRDRENEMRRMEIELEDNDGDEGVFVPKWLTRRDLFELQLKDVTFRRSVLTQASIIVDFLLGLTEKAKENWTSDRLNATNKSVMFPFTLSAEDEAYFLNMQKSFQKTTFTSVDFDPAYLRTINTIMQRDRYWQDWKLQNCPTFEERPLDREEVLEAKKKLENTLSKPRKKFWNAMGTAPLTKIWKIKTGINLLSDPKKYSIPDAKSYYNQIKEATEKFKQSHTIEVPEEAPIAEKTGSLPGTAEEKQGQPKSTDGNSDKAEDKIDDHDDDVIEVDNPVEVKPLPPVMKKVLVISKQEQREFDEDMGSKTWRGLRAARSQGLWAKFGLVTKEMGFSGLYEVPPVVIQTLPSANRPSQTPPVTPATSVIASPAPHNEEAAQVSTPGTPMADVNSVIPKKRATPKSEEADDYDARNKRVRLE